MATAITTDQLALVLVVFLLIFGVWLVGLSCLMWRNHQRKGAKGKAEEPEAPAAGSEKGPST